MLFDLVLPVCVGLGVRVGMCGMNKQRGKSQKMESHNEKLSCTDISKLLYTAPDNPDLGITNVLN